MELEKTIIEFFIKNDIDFKYIGPEKHMISVIVTSLTKEQIQKILSSEISNYFIEAISTKGETFELLFLRPILAF